MMRNEHKLEAFEEYFKITVDKAFQRAFWVAHRKGLSYADAEDVAQETLLAMLVNLERSLVDEILYVPSWIHRVATNKTNDLLRTRGRGDERQSRLERVAKGEQQGNELGEGDLSHDSAVRLAEQAIEQLSPTLRSVAVLLWDPVEISFDLMPHVTVAALLDIPEDTVKSRARLIRAFFRKHRSDLMDSFGFEP